jgi:hypothetical protein
MRLTSVSCATDPPGTRMRSPGTGMKRTTARARVRTSASCCVCKHTSGGPWTSTCPPTKQHKRLAHARAAGADGLPRHAPADAGSVGRGRGLAALPRPSQSRPASDKLNWLKIGTRRAARHRGPAHALWFWAEGRGAAACDARLVRAARGVQRAQQRAARALFPILSPTLPDFLDFRKGALARIFRPNFF